MPREERLERGTDRRIEEARVMLRIGQLPVVLQPDKPTVRRRPGQGGRDSGVPGETGDSRHRIVLADTVISSAVAVRLGK